MGKSSIAAWRSAASACALSRSRKQWQVESPVLEDVHADAARAMEAPPGLGYAHTGQHDREHNATTAIVRPMQTNRVPSSEQSH